MIETTLCYLERGGQYLMLHRTKKEGDANRDKWIGVGGKLEPGETPEDCARREVWEETGLTMTDCAYRGMVLFRSDRWPEETMHLFHSRGFRGSLRADCDEGDLCWVDKARIPALPLWAGDKIFLRLLDTDRPFFRLSLRYEGETLAEAILDGEAIL